MTASACSKGMTRQIGKMFSCAVKSPRNREIDIAIAATAISHDATLWTLNARDFSDVPGLQLL